MFLRRQEFRLEGHQNDVSALSFLNHKNFLISGSLDHSLKIWDLSTQRELNTLKGHSESISCISVSSNDNYFASGSLDKTVKL